MLKSLTACMIGYNFASKLNFSHPPAHLKSRFIDCPRDGSILMLLFDTQNKYEEEECVGKICHFFVLTHLLKPYYFCSLILLFFFFVCFLCKTTQLNGFKSVN